MQIFDGQKNRKIERKYDSKTKSIKWTISSISLLFYMKYLLFFLYRCHDNLLQLLWLDRRLATLYFNIGHFVCDILFGRHFHKCPWCSHSRSISHTIEVSSMGLLNIIGLWIQWELLHFLQSHGNVCLPNDGSHWQCCRYEYRRCPGGQ